ncbi:hypothetical protein JCM10450v2_003552 [Rhodotorula kratochvilovae]
MLSAPPPLRPSSSSYALALWAEVLEYLLPPDVQHRDYRTAKQALHNCRLVSRSFDFIARPLYWRHLVTTFAEQLDDLEQATVHSAAGTAGAAHAFAQQVVIATSELSSLIVAIAPAGMQNLVDLRLLYSPLDSRTPTLLALDNIAACHNLRRLALEHVHISCKRKATFPRLEELVMSNVWLHDFNRSRFAGDAFPALRAFCTTPMTMHSSQDLGLARGCPHLSPALLAQLDVI